ncbi:EAL domain-containing protein [Moritella sp. 24]|uniref:putative bifunctional diguanylate cyclase/phosphodiesterase n=1 Tax=Moritella sp. 24 TaxID=2746230 RepID=UPI001BA4EEF2|nr:GGDEF domain-containing protein [Moritella sp. 24]QUM75341.1 EAL domain-containing protein [Moritella sp. 24]
MLEKSLAARSAQLELKLSRQQKSNALRRNILELIVNSQPVSEILLEVVKGVELDHEGMICSILLLDPETKQLTHGASTQLPSFYNDAIDGILVGAGVGSCGTAAFSGERVIVEDIATHDYWCEFTPLAKQAGLASCWSEPIIGSNRKVLGTFAIYHRHVCSPSDDDFEIIEQSANLASIAIELAGANEKIWQQENHDNLTGLFNQKYINHQLNNIIQQDKSHDQKLAVIHLNLDGFKEINDNLERKWGNELLLQTASRIKDSIRSQDHVARLDADQFIIIIPNLADDDVSEQTIQTLYHNLSTPFKLNDKVHHISACIGITFYPDDALTAENIFNNAEQAVLSAKAYGRGSHHYFNSQMREAVLARASIINDMQRAIENEEFSLVYQPVIDLTSGQVNKVEALLRWHHPSKGLIPPLDFIPLAEEIGVINNIGRWVFKTAMHQVAAWRKHLNPNLKVSINSSPLEFRNSTSELAFDYIKKHNLDPTSLVIEITEGLLIESTDDVTDKLHELRDKGIQIAIDDFGTGYASLSYLKKFNVDYLKIDKSFVMNMTRGDNDHVICKAILMMAKQMGLKVIAEGIETKEHFELLQQMNCECGQGYHIARPLTPEDFEAYYLNRSKN